MSDVLRNNSAATRPRRQVLTASDGVVLDSVLISGSTARTSAVVIANGFTGTWRSSNTKRLARKLLALGDVLTFDFRGHYDSTGSSTVGDQEILDLEAAVSHLRGLGYTSIATVGFSMGAAVAVRHAGHFRGVAATVAVSGPGWWYYRGSARMRLLTAGVENTWGRFFLRVARKVRVTDRHWDPVPPSPTDLAGRIAPAGLLVVHGDADSYFPIEHAELVYGAAHEPKELWIEPGMGHAECAVSGELSDRIVAWLGDYTGSTGSTGDSADAAGGSAAAD